MINMIKNLLSLLLLLTFISANSQEQLPDFQLRISPSVDYKFAKKWTVSFEYRYALDNDLSTFRNSAFESGLKYKLTKKSNIEANYRFTTSYENDSHLIFAVYKYTINLNKRFSLKSSTRYQFRTGSFDAEYMQFFKQPLQLLREKITLEYNVPKSKASIYIAPEIFLKVADNESTFLEYNRMRYNAGVDYSMKYGNSVGLGFFYEDRQNPTKRDRFVFTTKYNLSIDELTKKIKKNKNKKNGIEEPSKKKKKIKK